MDDPDERDVAAMIQDSVRALRDTPAGQRLRSRAFRQEHAAEALLRHPDPVMREIGQQLRDGTMSPSDVLRVPAYTEAFQRAAVDARDRLDPQRIAAELSGLAERSVEETRGRQRPADRGSSW